MKRKTSSFFIGITQNMVRHSDPPVGGEESPSRCAQPEIATSFVLAMTRFLVLRNSSFLLGIILVGCWIPSMAQVSNNGIEQRIHLSPEGNPIQSTTAGSTVEWECINKKLTSKCIVYHNDQWFTFSVPDPGTYFLNVSNQVCKDLYGIQMIIIDGNPCDAENYTIKRCIDRLSMDDLHVELGMLKANQLYLLNIDGFLGDYCSFEIQLSKKPEGIPEQFSLETNNFQLLPRSENQVNLRWQASDSLLASIHEFEIFRKEAKEKKFTFLTHKNIQSNAAGIFLHDYEYTDTLLHFGVYDYAVFAKGDTTTSVVFKKNVSWIDDQKPVRINHVVTIPLTFSKPGPIDILYLDPVTDWVLKQNSGAFTFQNPTVQLSFFSLFSKGVRDIKINVKNSKTREINTFRYFLGEKGWELRQPITH